MSSTIDDARPSAENLQQRFEFETLISDLSASAANHAYLRGLGADEVYRWVRQLPCKHAYARQRGDEPLGLRRTRDADDPDSRHPCVRHRTDLAGRCGYDRNMGRVLHAVFGTGEMR
jgi:hypothetical protein